jgi:hypothetical protein
MLFQKMMKEGLILSSSNNEREKSKTLINFMKSRNLFSKSLYSLINSSKTDLGKVTGVGARTAGRLAKD